MTNQQICEKVRNRLTVERKFRPDAEAEAHLAHCPACRAFAHALRSCHELANPEPLYTSALKARTMAAMSARTETAVRPPLTLLAIGAIASLGVTFLIPGLASGWFFSRLVGPSHAMVALGWAAALGAGFFISLAGMIPAGLTLLKEENHV